MDWKHRESYLECLEEYEYVRSPWMEYFKYYLITISYLIKPM